MSEEDTQPVVRRPRRNRGDGKGSDDGTKPERRSDTRKKVLIGVGSVLAVALIAVGAVTLWGFWTISHIDRVDVTLSDVEVDTEPFNMLVVGSDSREKITPDDPGAGGMLGKEAPSGQRSDTLMIARVDLKNDRVDLLSIPRDLWVPIAGKDKSQRINTAYATSAQTTVDTIEETLGIPIHHFAEVDFTGFRSLVNTLGGVPMYFEYPVKDTNSGLNIRSRGCVVLDGEQGLAFARSRHLKWYDGNEWHSDPTGDLGRMNRQQLLTRAALAKANSMGLRDVGKLKGLVDAAVGSVAIDSKWGTGDLISVGRRLADMDPQNMQTHGLPVVPHRTDGGAAVVLLDEEAAEPVLAMFRGTAPVTPVTTTTTPPPDPRDVTVKVLNSSAPDGEGLRVSYVLSGAGFTIDGVSDGKTDKRRSVVRYAKGQKTLGELVARWIHPNPELREDKDLKPGFVVVDLGSDFAKVYELDEPDGDTSTDTGDSSDVTDDGDAGGSSTGTGVTTTSTTTTTQPGWTPGVAPEGTVCR